MLRSTLLIALRNLRQNRGFAALNVFGLALGAACLILIALYIQDELGYDRFNERLDRVARVDITTVMGGEEDPSGRTPGVLAPSMVASMPSVEAAVRFGNADPVLRAQGAPIEAEELLLADPDVFDVFTLPLLSGDPGSALAEPGSIVLSETLARRLFGDAPAQGQTLDWKEGPLTVTGVMADMPRQSHIQFDGLISLSTAEDPGWFYDNWFTTAFATYVALREGTSHESFQAQLPAFIEAAAGDAMREEDRELRLEATRLADLYLSADDGIGIFGDATTLGILALVALFVLLIAAVNYTNLATARSLDRAREIGVRKTLGAERSGLILQFLAESLVLSIVAVGIAVVLVQLALPVFREVSGKPLSLPDLGAGWLGVIAVVGATGLLAGAYPAFILSSFKPSDVLKGTFSTGHRGRTLRQGLVVLQFSISVALIAATVIVFSQVRHMQDQDLGIDLGGETSQLVVLPFMGDTTVVSQLSQLRARLLDIPGVDGASSSLSAPTYGTYSGGGNVEQPDGSQSDEINATMVLADPSYATVYGLTLLAGRHPRGLAEDAPPETPREYVLSEAAIREVGYASPEAALDKRVAFWGIEGTIVGVVADHHTEGLQAAVEPLAVLPDDGSIIPPNVFTLRVRTASLPSTIEQVETLWADAVPERPFTYTFLDEDFAAQYQAEQRFGRLFGLFSGLSIAIACFGLFGLAAHAAATRTKEIGVRRVLGATVAQVVVLMSRGVVGLVALGFVLAAPIVIVGMSRWLDGFAYRISVGWIPLALAGAVVLVLAVVTVAGHAVRAAVADPVRALRSE
ncbi:MAG: ABC transporter permease [Bacteroidota bacterium]